MALDRSMSPPRALYVHVPFCHTLCGYCDFYSLVFDKRQVSPLVDALLTDLERSVAGRDLRVDTIFVGGGTPTTLPANELGRLLTGVAALADDLGRVEFTCEANPATVTPEIAATLAQTGVNRVSVGAQSFHRSELRVLDRIHEPAQVGETVRNLRAAGIPQVNLDLIFAAPGQSLGAWRDNLQQALALGPQHLSCYALTYEEGTPLTERLRRGEFTPADDEHEANLYETTIDTLAAAGFEQYEISNFAQPGRECRHNLVYWRNEPYLGVGPSAAGFDDGVRYKNVPDLAAYSRAIASGRSPRIEEERLSPEHRARETMMLSLRLTAGVDRGRFVERFQVDPLELFSGIIEPKRELGLIAVDRERVALTRRGMLLADAIIAEFL